MMIRVLVYGSLIDEPEHPDRVRDLRPALWSGHRRRFNLRSRYRGCAHEHALFDHVHVPDFSDESLRHSLVLGTAPAPGQTLSGALVTWEDPDGQTLQALDRREGFDADNPESSPYLRRTVRVDVRGGSEEAFVYVTNPEHPRVVSLDPTTEARVLLHATPAHPPPAGDRPRGAQYLLPLVRWMRSQRLADPYLDELVQEMERHVGPLAEHPVAWAGVDLIGVGPARGS